MHRVIQPHEQRFHLQQDTWYYTKTNEFLQNNLPLNEEGEYNMKDLEKKGLIVDFKELDRGTETKENFIFKAEKFNKIFKDLGLEIVENNDLKSSAMIVGGEKPRIEFNSDKIKKDTVYHEFGHALVDMIGYEDKLVQNAINELRATPLYYQIRILNPTLTKEQLDKEVLTTKIGIEASNKDSQSKFRLFYNLIKNKIGKLLGLKESAVDQLVNKLVNGKVENVIKERLSTYEQHQADFRIINNVFVNKQEVLENAIIKIEQKIRDYFSQLEPEQRYGNPLYRDFKNLSEMLKEHRIHDINKGIVEFLTFAYLQTQDLEKRINSYLYPTPKDGVNFEKPIITSKFIQDLLNYNEALS